MKETIQTLKTKSQILRYAIIVMMLLSVFLSTMLLFSCTSKEKESSSIPIFSKENTVDTVHMSSLIKDWHYVILETKPECLISEIEKISIDDSLLFIESMASNWELSVFVFNKEGKFITQIGDKGNARNEYLSIYFWAIDKWNKEVLIGDGSKKKLKRYAYDGSFLGDIPFNDNFLDERKMYVISKDHFAFQRDIPVNHIRDVMAGYEERAQKEQDKILKSQSRFLVTDRELNLVSRLSDRGIISDEHSWSCPSSIFVNKTIYVRDPILNDTLYRWENNQFIPECLIYVDNCKANDIDLEPIGKLWKKYMKEYSIFKSEHIVDNRYFFTEGSKGQYLIDLTTKSIHHLNQGEFGKVYNPFYVNSLFSDKNYLIGSKDATDILELKEYQEKANIKNSSKEQKLYDSLEEDGNPVIFFYELKD